MLNGSPPPRVTQDKAFGKLRQRIPRVAEDRGRTA